MDHKESLHQTYDGRSFISHHQQYLPLGFRKKDEEDLVLGISTSKCLR